MNRILRLKLIALQRNTHRLIRVSQLVDLVLLFSEPCHVPLGDLDGRADDLRLSVFLDSVEPGAVDAAVEDFDDGAGFAVVVDGGVVAWGPDFHDVWDAGGVCLDNHVELASIKKWDSSQER